MKLLPYAGKEVSLEDLIVTEGKEPYSEIHEPSVETLKKLNGTLLRTQRELREISIDDKLKALEYVGSLWEKKSYERRRKLEEFLPKTTGYHPNIIEFELSLFPEVLNEEFLKESLDNPMCFYGGRKCLDGFVKVGKNEYVAANPRGPVFIIGGGNSTIPPLIALLTSLYTNNYTLLRPSFANHVGLYEVMKSFEDVIDDRNTEHSVRKVLRKLTNATLIAYMSHDSEAYAYLLRRSRVGAVNFWGGEPALSRIKRMVAENPYNPEFIINGPLTGVAIIDGNYMKKVGCQDLSRKLALDMVLYNQQMCNSPTEAYYLGSFEEGKRFGKELAKAVEEYERNFPIEVSETEAFKTQLVRRSLRRSGSKVYAPETGEAKWTIVVSEYRSRIDEIVNSNFSFSIHERPLFLEVITLDYIDDALEKIEKLPERACYAGVEKVQTVGYAMDKERVRELARELAMMGIYRVVPIGQMYYRTAFEPSDGEFLPRKFIFFSYFRAE